MIHFIEIATREGLRDAAGETARGDLRDAGLEGLEAVHAVHVYILEGELSPADVDRAARELFADPVAEVFRVDGAVLDEAAEGTHVLGVQRKPGVMDPVATSARRALAELDLHPAAVRTARKYVLRGVDATPEEVRRAGAAVLANEVIEALTVDEPIALETTHGTPWTFQRVEVPLADADDDALMKISRDGSLALDAIEMRAIRDWYASEGRVPTDVELETIAQTWSEHCKHKTLAGIVRYEDPAGGTQEFDNLLKETIFAATLELDLDWCLSVFSDNAGIIALDDDHAVCFKVETHNHPSAIEPYGGAGTGIGGCIRDILGAGLGAKPILNTDVFCFGPPDLPAERVPRGTLHPLRILKGVVAGVRDYGNRMGIPTASGALYFDERYVGNPLVYCGCVGIMPRDCVHKEPRKGDHVVLVGGRTGRDGIHGVNFSSMELNEESEMLDAGAVQIGDPVTEKKVLDGLLRARDAKLYTAVTDCGGGGLSSAIGEMGEELGVTVELSAVPLKYEGLSAAEIWISEAQERMVFAVPPENVEAMLEIFREEDVHAHDIGTFTGDGRLHITYDGQEVADLDMTFLHDGLPRQTRDAVWKAKKHPEIKRKDPPDLGPDLLAILGCGNVASKEWVIRQYDHEVQGLGVLKPLVGEAEDGPGDATVLKPLRDSNVGIAVACGMNPHHGDVDPYHMAASSIDEALRNVVAVGANPDRVALLDNFSWGNTDHPDRLGGLVRAALACRDVSLAYRTPFISGKDSLNNEYQTKKGTIVIPPSLLISAIAILDDVEKTVTMDLKETGSGLWLLGTTYAELGGSHYGLIHDARGNRAPEVRAEESLATMRALHRAIGLGLVRAAHDLSEGGLGVAVAEMAFAGGIGAAIHLRTVPSEEGLERNDLRFFSESNGRFLVEVRPEHEGVFARLFDDLPAARIGETTEARILNVAGLDGSNVLERSLEELKTAWQTPLRW